MHPIENFLNSKSVDSLKSSYNMFFEYDKNKVNLNMSGGTEKTQYSCQYCGTKASTISNLTIGTCVRHPLGSNKGHHEPALN